MTKFSRSSLILAGGWLVLALFPLVAIPMQGEFYLTLLSRLMIFALAASSLNLILGYGGMVSFGHAAYLGAGAYVTAILAQSGWTWAWIVWPVAILFSALLALVIGAICLRTKGVYFIMITLAFAQMLYYLIFSLEIYGGDDGLSVKRSLLASGLSLRNDTVMYYVALVMLTLALYVIWRLVHSRFGQVLRSIKENESRMAALGYSVYQYQLLAFVIAGALAGLAGVLSANLNGYASPNLLSWQQSGHLMMMVILGGVGNFWGGVIGAVVLLLIEEWLSGLTIHWQLGVGAILLLIVLFAPKGIMGWFSRGAA